MLKNKNCFQTIMLLYAILHGNSLHVADDFIQTVLLECINESTSILYHTMTVLLEYIDCLLQFSKMLNNYCY